MAEAAARDNGPRPTGVNSALERFREYLAEQGLRFTTEREAIAKALFENNAHFEAEELLARMRSDGSRVSRATVYRTLDLLVTAGLARKVRLGAEHNYFEHILGRRQHEHMVCIQCGEVIEWFDADLEGVLSRNAERYGFVPARYTVQIFGHCASCADESR